MTDLARVDPAILPDICATPGCDQPRYTDCDNDPKIHPLQVCDEHMAAGLRRMAESGTYPLTPDERRRTLDWLDRRWPK